MDILELVTAQIRRPNSKLAKCLEWCAWDSSGIYQVIETGQLFRVWVSEDHIATSFKEVW